MLKIRSRHRELGLEDAEMLHILTRELERRVQYGPPAEVDTIVRVMENLI